MPDTPHLKNGMYAILHRYPEGCFQYPADGRGSGNTYSKMIRGGQIRPKGGRGLADTPPPHGRGVCTDFFWKGRGVYRRPPHLKKGVLSNSYSIRGLIRRETSGFSELRNLPVLPPAHLKDPARYLLPDPLHGRQFLQRGIHNPLHRPEVSQQEPGILQPDLRERRDNILLFLL